MSTTGTFVADQADTGQAGMVAAVSLFIKSLFILFSTVLWNKNNF